MPALTALGAVLAATLASSAGPAFAAAPAGNVRQTIDWNVSAAQLKADCSGQIASAKNRVNAIVAAPGPRTAATVLIPLENVQADLSDRTVADQFLFNVSTSRAVRDASQACQDQINAFITEFGARPDIYKALLAVKAGGTASAPYEAKLLSLYLETALRAGAALSAHDRSEFITLSQELGRLQNAYGANLGNDKTTVTLAPAQTAGLDADFIATLKKNPDGTLIVPVNEATITRFLNNASDPSARKAYYLAFYQRGGEKNVVLLERAIANRYRLARLLGFKTWADYQLANKMARTPTRVIPFLQNLDSKLLAGARSDLATLATLKAKDTGDPSARIEAWDYSYYDNALRKTKYAVDANEIKQYFPVQHTIDAVLSIYSTLLGVTFAPGADDAWIKSPEVLHYTVTDKATGRFLGDTYFDLYPRDGKYGHFANWPLLPNRLLPNGKIRAPLAAIVGNWPQPAPGKPALLSHDDVETFFHEFGHNMAAMLATAPYETLSAGFRQDFIEAPSQMLENWVWDPMVLRQLSSRWDTGAPIPDELIQKLIAARYVDQSYAYTRQAFYALVDMEYHSAGPKVDTTKVWAATQDRTTPLPYLAGTLPQASFGHLMGGYDAGYYGYLWSKVYAQDMFTRFAAQGLENPVAGLAYRQDILAPASTYEPDQEIRTFLGRPMSPDAFYKTLGLESTTAKP